MKLKIHHKKTVDDGFGISFYMNTEEYQIIKSWNGYAFSIREYSDFTGHSWFEEMCTFEEWDKLALKIKEMAEKGMLRI
ncbi:MAG: hypothetical protein ACRDDY_03645 [Clostridium sp.]|uniref:hypothetical protein n=1 Tax=Clostridium sp. TaxID=1506 RepID=UPI003EE511EA